MLERKGCIAGKCDGRRYNVQRKQDSSETELSNFPNVLGGQIAIDDLARSGTEQRPRIFLQVRLAAFSP